MPIYSLAKLLIWEKAKIQIKEKKAEKTLEDWNQGVHVKNIQVYFTKYLFCSCAGFDQGLNMAFFSKSFMTM